MLKSQGKLLTKKKKKKTDGYGSGEELEEDTYVNITEGALIGRGTTHFFERDTLEEILHFAGFQNINIDTILYTACGVQIEQYIAIAEK